MATGVRTTGIVTRRTLVLAVLAGSAAVALSVRLLIWIEEKARTRLPEYARLVLGCLLLSIEWASISRPRLESWSRCGWWPAGDCDIVAFGRQSRPPVAPGEGMAGARLDRDGDGHGRGDRRRMAVSDVGRAGRRPDAGDAGRPAGDLAADYIRRRRPAAHLAAEEAGRCQRSELIIVGESSAQGVPYNAWVSIGHMIAWKLTEAVPTLRVRPQVLANSGETIEQQHHRLAMIPRRPDLMIVYCGHNEFGSRLYGAREVRYYVDDGAPTGWRRLLDAVEAVSPLCGLIRRSSERFRLALPATGRRDLIDRPAFTREEADLLLADFRRRLDAIVTFGVRSGAVCVLISPPGNDAGFEPNRSYLRARTPRAAREAFRRDFLAAFVGSEEIGIPPRRSPPIAA